MQLKRRLLPGLVVLALGLAGSGLAAPLSGEKCAAKMRSALERIGAVRITKAQATTEWSRLQVELADEAIPLTLDIVFSLRGLPDRILYMLPGGALNFDSDFFTPEANNLAHFMRRQGYVVVGINPREDHPLTLENPAVMADWGLAKRKQDIRKVISAVGAVLPLPYDLVGHSAGAMQALDYAATYSDRLGKVMAIDMDGPFDPATEATLVDNAERTYQAYLQLLQGGSYANTAFQNFKNLVIASTVAPLADSGVPRPIPGNFTFEGLLHFAFIFTGLLPGDTTPYTGLSDGWYFSPGYFAGTYVFNADPALDQYALTHSPLEVAKTATLAVRSGLHPLATRRDTLAVFAGNGAYPLDWAAIDEKVVWVNAELGFGNHDYGARLIRQGGNPSVTYTVVPGYGHADPVFSTTAEQDFWIHLVQ